MSLRVWLPLNGDLHNQGLSGLTVTNNGATINNSGKIGKCYQFGTAASDITIPATAMTSFTTECSITFWLNILTWNGSWATFFQAGLASTSWTSYIFGFLRNGTASTCCFTISNGSSASNANYLTPEFDLNKWYHVALIYKTGHCLIYINGQLYQDYSTSIVPNFAGITTIKLGRCTNGSSYQTNCLMNDIRIYDHALSELEVKEIARAKVLHYPLNQFLPYQSVKYDKNIYTEPDGSKWLHIIHHNNPNGGVFSSTDTWESGVYIDENRWFDFYPIIRILNTYEFMVKQKTTSSATEVKYRWIQNKSPLIATYNDIQPSNVTRITTTGYTDGNYGGLYVTNNNSYLCIANTNNGNWYGAFGCWKVYQNGIPGYPNTVITTGYMDLYIKISDYISSTIEYDISGYYNNGIKIGTFTYSTDTPKYNLSTNFNGSSLIEADPLPSETLTISAWVNFADTSGSSYRMVVHDKNTGLAIGYYSSKIITYVGSSGGGAGSCVTANLSSNTWYHIVVVKTGSTTRDTYINGVKAAVTSNNWWGGDMNKLHIGGRHISGVYAGYTTGKIVDVRAYATALSAQDILSLYHNSAFVDEQGIIHGAIH